MKTIKVGCCGFPVAQKKYYKDFSLIEINQSFYQLPELKTALKWREQAPEGFEFIVKAWQLITHPATSSTYRKLREKIPESKKYSYGHFRQTDEVAEAWRRTFEFGQALKAKIYLFQTPTSFQPTLGDLTNITKFFKSVPRQGLTFIWEPRGNWPEELVVKLCRDLNLVHCVNPLKNKPFFGHIRYFRLHGTYEGKRIVYDYKYSTNELSEVVAKADKSLNYVLFNNSSMHTDALLFQKIVKK